MGNETRNHPDCARVGLTTLLPPNEEIRDTRTDLGGVMPLSTTVNAGSMKRDTREIVLASAIIFHLAHSYMLAPGEEPILLVVYTAATVVHLSSFSSSMACARRCNVDSQFQA